MYLNSQLKKGISIKEICRKLAYLTSLINLALSEADPGPPKTS